MKTFLGQPKKAWFYTYKIAFAHQFFALIMVPVFLAAVTLLCFAIAKGIFGAIVMGVIFSMALGWANYTGFKAIYLCKKAGIDYNKPWHEV